MDGEPPLSLARVHLDLLGELDDPLASLVPQRWHFVFVIEELAVKQRVERGVDWDGSVLEVKFGFVQVLQSRLHLLCVSLKPFLLNLWVLNNPGFARCGDNDVKGCVLPVWCITNNL